MVLACSAEAVAQRGWAASAAAGKLMKEWPSAVALHAVTFMPATALLTVVYGRLQACGRGRVTMQACPVESASDPADLPGRLRRLASEEIQH
jgi:hypothetical protein